MFKISLPHRKARTATVLVSTIKNNHMPTSSIYYAHITFLLILNSSFILCMYIPVKNNYQLTFKGNQSLAC